MLNTYRVLDLTDGNTALCGKIFGDFGADTIIIEPPQGNCGRATGPFYKDTPDPEKSLSWYAFNCNKRSITLDIKTKEGQSIFKQLAKTADVVLECFDPGEMDRLGLGYSHLHEINPNIIMTSISSFGQEGPYRTFRGSDMVLWALSGMMSVTGDPDRPPLTPSYPHSYMFGAMQAAVATMIALFHRNALGRGQHIDVSALMSLAWVTQPDCIGMYDLFGQVAERTGRMRIQPFNGIKMPVLWPCKDGDIGFIFMLGPGLAKANASLAQWIENDDPTVSTFKSIDWITFRPEDISEELGIEITDRLLTFFKRHTKRELFEGSLQKGIQLYPSLTPTETLEFEQLQSRDYWKRVYHPQIDETLLYPGPAVRTTAIADTTIKPPPRLGEHNHEIYHDELGIASTQLYDYKKMGVI